jgi:FtsH-binding integral membrane protein
MNNEKRNKDKKLMFAGLLLPYIAIIVMAVGVNALPHNTQDEKWEYGAGIAFLVPFIASFVGAILVGLYGVRRSVHDRTGIAVVGTFIYSFLLTGLFHFFITMALVAQAVYMIAGYRH